MEDSKNSLHRRADGFHETPMGAIAVVMTRFSREVDDQRIFDFVLSPSGPTLSASWNMVERLQIFDARLAVQFIANGWAKHPDAAALAWYAGLAPPEPAATPVEALTPAAPPKVAAAPLTPAEAATAPLQAFKEGVPPMLDPAPKTPPPPKK